MFLLFNMIIFLMAVANHYKRCEHILGRKMFLNVNNCVDKILFCTNWNLEIYDWNSEKLELFHIGESDEIAKASRGLSSYFWNKKVILLILNTFSQKIHTSKHAKSFSLRPERLKVTFLNTRKILFIKCLEKLGCKRQWTNSGFISEPIK